MDLTRVRNLAVLGGLVITIVIVLAAYIQGASDNALNCGTFLVLSLTLIALIYYAADTHRIADLNQKQWDDQQTPTPVYQMGFSPQNQLVVIQLVNTSRYLVSAYVRCNLHVYGQPVGTGPAFDGESTWSVFPFQSSQQVFSLKTVLAQKGKTIRKMKAEASAANREQQLTMDLEIEFQNELGKRKSLPRRRHFFDFQNLRWVPVLT